MDRIKEMMDSLSELDDSQVAELQGEIISQFETVEKEDPTPETVDAMTSLADMLDTVRSELKQREAAVEQTCHLLLRQSNLIPYKDMYLKLFDVNNDHPGSCYRL